MHSPCCRSGWAPARSQAGCRSCCSPGPGPSERRACTPGRRASLRSWGTALRCTASSCLQTAVAREGGEPWEMPGGATRVRGPRESPAKDFLWWPAWFKVSWTGARWPRCCSGLESGKAYFMCGKKDLCEFNTCLVWIWYRASQMSIYCKYNCLILTESVFRFH